MGWSGGLFSRSKDWTEDEANGYNIESARMDEEDDNFATGINSCLHKGGQNTATANLPMGGYIHTGVGLGTAYNHYARLDQVQKNSGAYGGTSGGTNALTLSLSPAPTAYTAGQVINFIAGATNTTAATLNVNSLGAKDIYYKGAALSGYEMIASRVYTVFYDGTRFQLLGVEFKHGCVVYSDTQQAFNQSTDTAILFGDEDADYTDAPMHSTSSNTSRFTVLRTGLYMCTYYCEFGGTITDQRAMWISKNAGAVNNYEYIVTLTTSGYTTAWGQISGIVLCQAGDYLEFEVANITGNDTIEAARAGVHILAF